ELSRAWFNHDFAEPPAMSRVMAWDLGFGGPHGRAMKRAMGPGEFSRGEKEMVAAVGGGGDAGEDGVKAQTAAGELQGVTGDARWDEAAQVVGIPNALNVAGDGLGVLGPIDEATAPPDVRALLDEIRAFYGGGEAPACFRLIAHDAAYAADVWEAARHAY